LRAESRRSAGDAPPADQARWKDLARDPEPDEPRRDLAVYSPPETQARLRPFALWPRWAITIRRAGLAVRRSGGGAAVFAVLRGREANRSLGSAASVLPRPAIDAASRTAFAACVDGRFGRSSTALSTPRGLPPNSAG